MGLIDSEQLLRLGAEMKTNSYGAYLTRIALEPR
jgi:hypothetical protein